MTERWSQGVLIGLPIAGLVVLVLLAVAIFSLGYSFTQRCRSYDRGFFRYGVPGFGTGLIVVVLFVTGWGMWPWDASYHRWYPKSGVVAQTGSRLFTSDKEVNQRFVVQFTDGGLYGCDDTRCSVVKPGDKLSLACKREYQYTGISGWACSYVEDRRG